jgi:hypothetical protein
MSQVGAENDIEKANNSLRNGYAIWMCKKLGLVKYGLKKNHI